MKYLCKAKGNSNTFGIGETLEKALDDFQGDDVAPINELEWYTLSPIKVKLSLDNNTAAKKSTAKNGARK